MILYQTLSTVLLNNCAGITTKGILAFLENLKSLERIEANKGQNSSVQQAIAILDSEHRHHQEMEIDAKPQLALKLKSFPKLKNFLFRNPGAGLATIAKFCPNLIKVDFLRIY